MQNKKQAIILSVIASIALLVLIVGATYAYFQASGGAGTSANLRVTTYTTDVFNFEVGNDISIYADATSFASGKGNAVGNTFAKAMLTANNKTNTATEHYYLYLNISNNTFTYTQNENTPELLLTITDAGGNAVTDITSLAYKTVTDGKGASISGYDITNKSGLITLFNNKEITASPTKTDEWNITVTLVNYDKDQSKNAGKSFSAKLMIQKEKIKESVATVCSNGQTLSSCIIAMDGKDDTLYHHTSSLANGAGDNSYRYAGGDYVLTDAGKATGATMIIRYDDTVTTALIDFYCNGTKQYVGYGCDSLQTHYYLIKGETTQYQTYNEALNVAVEKGYLTKDNVKNFVCFGSDASPCPTENLYRIIGVFEDKVKLIKHDYATSALLGTDGDYMGSDTPISSTYKGSLTSIDTYYWNNVTKKNTWSESNLNKINLNTNFINNIGSTWANKIATTAWKVGGNTWNNMVNQNASVVYQNEIVSPVENTTYDAKIGLMYVSDYGFAASPSAWTKTLYNYDGNDANGTSIETINWMHMGNHEWSISCRSDFSEHVFVEAGHVNNGSVFSNYGARPSFSLLSSTTYVSGSGSKSNPIRIN